MLSVVDVCTPCKDSGFFWLVRKPPWRDELALSSGVEVLSRRRLIFSCDSLIFFWNKWSISRASFARLGSSWI